MVPTISLSDLAYKELRSHRKAGESDSDVILRLVSEASGNQKDPMRFFRRPPEPERHADQERKIRHEMRQKDIRRGKESQAEREG